MSRVARVSMLCMCDASMHYVSLISMSQERRRYGVWCPPSSAYHPITQPTYQYAAPAALVQKNEKGEDVWHPVGACIYKRMRQDMHVSCDVTCNVCVACTCDHVDVAYVM